MTAETTSLEIEIPEGLDVEIEGTEIKVRSEKGELKRNFGNAPVQIEKEGNKIKISSPGNKRKDKALADTWKAHLNNMMIGISEGFRRNLKITYSHFPIKVTVQKDRALIENFLGEREPRVAKIVGNTTVKASKESVEISGINKEDVGQTTANLRLATKVKYKDPRRFTDGLIPEEVKK